MRTIFYAVYAAWFLSELAILFLLRSEKTKDTSKDKNTIGLLWFVIILANALAIACSYLVPALISSHSFVASTGLLLMVSGILFRLYAIWSLGSMFTVDVSIRQGHALKRDGIYHYLRHPSYTGGFLTFLGFGLTLNNWASLAILIVLVGAAFARRIRVEEAALIEAFGGQYAEYKKSTYALIPFIY